MTTVRLYHLAWEWQVGCAEIVEFLREAGDLRFESHFSEVPYEDVQSLKLLLRDAGLFDLYERRSRREKSESFKNPGSLGSVATDTGQADLATDTEQAGERERPEVRQQERYDPPESWRSFPVTSRDWFQGVLQDVRQDCTVGAAVGFLKALLCAYERETKRGENWAGWSHEYTSERLKAIRHLVAQAESCAALTASLLDEVVSVLHDKRLLGFQQLLRSIQTDPDYANSDRHKRHSLAFARVSWTCTGSSQALGYLLKELGQPDHPRHLKAIQTLASAPSNDKKTIDTLCKRLAAETNTPCRVAMLRLLRDQHRETGRLKDLFAECATAAERSNVLGVLALADPDAFLTQVASPEVRDKVDISATIATLLKANEAGESPDPAVVAAVLGVAVTRPDPSLTASALQLLSTTTVELAAIDPEMLQGIVRALQVHPDPSVRLALVQLLLTTTVEPAAIGPETLQDIVRALQVHPDPSVRLALVQLLVGWAQHPGCPEPMRNEIQNGLFRAAASGSDQAVWNAARNALKRLGVELNWEFLPRGTSSQDLIARLKIAQTGKGREQPEKWSRLTFLNQFQPTGLFFGKGFLGGYVAFRFVVDKQEKFVLEKPKLNNALFVVPDQSFLKYSKMELRDIDAPRIAHRGNWHEQVANELPGMLKVTTAALDTARMSGNFDSVLRNRRLTRECVNQWIDDGEIPSGRRVDAAVIIAEALRQGDHRD
jgi:hypothetical protein